MERVKRKWRKNNNDKMMRRVEVKYHLPIQKGIGRIFYECFNKEKSVLENDNPYPYKRGTEEKRVNKSKNIKILNLNKIITELKNITDPISQAFTKEVGRLSNEKHTPLSIYFKDIYYFMIEDPYGCEYFLLCTLFFLYSKNKLFIDSRDGDNNISYSFELNTLDVSMLEKIMSILLHSGSGRLNKISHLLKKNKLGKYIKIGYNLMLILVNLITSTPLPPSSSLILSQQYIYNLVSPPTPFFTPILRKNPHYRHHVHILPPAQERLVAPSLHPLRAEGGGTLPFYHRYTFDFRGRIYPNNINPIHPANSKKYRSCLTSLIPHPFCEEWWELYHTSSRRVSKILSESKKFNVYKFRTKREEIMLLGEEILDNVYFSKGPRYAFQNFIYSDCSASGFQLLHLILGIRRGVEEVNLVSSREQSRSTYPKKDFYSEMLKQFEREGSYPYYTLSEGRRSIKGGIIAYLYGGQYKTFRESLKIFSSDDFLNKFFSVSGSNNTTDQRGGSKIQSLAYSLWCFLIATSSLSSTRIPLFSLFSNGTFVWGVGNLMLKAGYVDGFIKSLNIKVKHSKGLNTISRQKRFFLYQTIGGSIFSTRSFQPNLVQHLESYAMGEVLRRLSYLGIPFIPVHDSWGTSPLFFPLLHFLFNCMYQKFAEERWGLLSLFLPFILSHNRRIDCSMFFYLNYIRKYWGGLSPYPLIFSRYALYPGD